MRLVTKPQHPRAQSGQHAAEGDGRFRASRRAETTATDELLMSALVRATPAT